MSIEWKDLNSNVSIGVDTSDDYIVEIRYNEFSKQWVLYDDQYDPIGTFSERLEAKSFAESHMENRIKKYR